MFIFGRGEEGGNIERKGNGQRVKFDGELGGEKQLPCVFTMSEKMYPRNAREYYMNMCIQGFGREEGGLDDLCQKSTKM